MQWSKEKALEEIQNQLAESYFWLMGGVENLSPEESIEYQMYCMDMAALFLHASSAEVISSENREITLKMKRVNMFDFFESKTQR